MTFFQRMYVDARSVQDVGGNSLVALLLACRVPRLIWSSSTPEYPPRRDHRRTHEHICSRVLYGIPTSR